MSRDMAYTVEIPAIYSGEELENLYPEPWKDSARKKFRKDLAEAIRDRRTSLNPLLELDPSVALRILQLAVRHRDAFEALVKLARKYKHNVPRMSDEDMREATNLAWVSKVMED